MTARQTEGKEAEGQRHNKGQNATQSPKRKRSKGGRRRNFSNKREQGHAEEDAHRRMAGIERNQNLKEQLRKRKLIEPNGEVQYGQEEGWKAKDKKGNDTK